MITLNCKLKPEDYIKAQYLHMRPSPWLKYPGIAFLSLWLVFSVASASLSGSLTRAFRALTPILFFGLFCALILFIILPRNVHRIFLQQKTLQIEYKSVISPEIIESTSEIGTARIRLSDFHKYKVDKDLILLYQSQAIFLIFPRRFFTLEEDFKIFLSYLEANLGSPEM
jgi:YcxB-like protein